LFHSQYFIDLGYEPANRQTTPDFLVSVTDPLSRIQRNDVPSAPRTADEFAKTFLQSEIGARNRAEIEQYEREHVGKDEVAQKYRESAHDDHAKTARNKSYVSIPLGLRGSVLRIDVLRIGRI